MRRSSALTRAARAALLLACATSIVRGLDPITSDDIAMRFEFNDGLDGWGQANMEGEQPELSAANVAGLNTLRFKPRLSREPGWIDSPPFNITVGDSTFAVFRMRHLLHATVGRLVFRNETLTVKAIQETGSWTGDQWIREFPVNADGQWHVYSVPVFPTRHATPGSFMPVSRLRLYPAWDVKGIGSAEIDWFRIMHAPTIKRVEGCSALNGVEPTPNDLPRYRARVRQAYPSLTQNFATVEEALARANATADNSLPFASTFNCAVTGGDRITIRGIHFGAVAPKVLVGGVRCGNITIDAVQTTVSCTLPPGTGVRVPVTIANGRVPVLTDSKPFLAYAEAPGAPAPPVVSNVNAFALDLTWMPVPDILAALSTTGYRIQWRAEIPAPTQFNQQATAHAGMAGVKMAEVEHDPVTGMTWGAWADEVTYGGSVTVGNVTTTTIRGLRPYARFQFRVAALVEDTVSGPAWARLDLYGHRAPIRGAVLGAWSGGSAVVRTLAYDFLFTHFDANATLDFGPAYANSSVNALGWSGGEGAYGLVIVGSAHIGNCNSTCACCDGFGGPGYLRAVKGLQADQGAGLPEARGEGDALNPFSETYAWNSGTMDWVPGQDKAVQSDAGLGSPDPLPALGLYDPAAVHPSWSLYARAYGLSPHGAFAGKHKREWLWDGVDFSGDLAHIPAAEYAAKLAAQRAAYQASLDAVTDVLQALLPTPPPPRPVFKDRAGRRLIGVDAKPTSFCRAICVAPAGFDAPYLNRVAQRSSTLFPGGSIEGAKTPFTSGSTQRVNDEDAIRGEAAALLAGVRPAPPNAITARVAAQGGGSSAVMYHRQSGEGDWRSWGPSVSGYNASAAVPVAGAGPDLSFSVDTTAPVTGRYHLAPATAALLSRDPDEPQVPMPNTTFPNGVSVLHGGPGAPNDTALAPCGPALRLTGSHPNQVGAVWYSRPQQVRDGFDTAFVFRVANPSSTCNIAMDDQYTHCRSRGGAGFAFVVQAWHPAAIGASTLPGSTGSGLGYDGLRNSLAVEFDMHHDGDQLDPWENHISVHTRGRAAGNSANHSYSLGHSTRVPDLTRGIHTARIVYDPRFDAGVITHPAFAASAAVADFETNAAYPAGGRPDWSAGFGTLSVYLNDEAQPSLIVPINLEATLDLGDSNGRAWVGFTAETGSDVWQTQDLLAWEFSQLRIAHGDDAEARAAVAAKFGYNGL